jgi:hypothetical protein
MRNWPWLLLHVAHAEREIFEIDEDGDQEFVGHVPPAAKRDE